MLYCTVKLFEAPDDAHRLYESVEIVNQCNIMIVLFSRARNLDRRVAGFQIWNKRLLDPRKKSQLSVII
jgi:hypothetical protein